MSKGESSSIEQILSAEKDRVSTEATKELKAKGAMDFKGDLNSKAKKEAERQIDYVEKYRATVAELEAFVTDPANAELVEANPQLVAELEDKKKGLASEEKFINTNLLQSPVVGDKAVRAEMRTQYLSAYAKDYIGPVSSTVTKTSMYSYNKPQISLDTFEVAHEVEAAADYDKLSNKLSEDGLKDGAVLKDISKKVLDRTDKALADFVTAFPKCQEDSEKLKVIYQNMRTEAGLPALAEGEDGDTLTYKNKSISLQNHSSEGMRKTVEQSKQDVLKKKKLIEMARKIKETKGFLGFGTLKKKNAQVDMLVRSMDPSFESKFDRSNPAAIDASADAVLQEFEDELVDDERWVGIVEVAQKGKTETSALATDVKVLRNFERVKAAKVKFEQQATQLSES